MDMRHEADKIFKMSISNKDKITALRNLELDCINELEAQDQNMHPELSHNVPEALRKTKDYLNILLGYINTFKVK